MSSRPKMRAFIDRVIELVGTALVSAFVALAVAGTGFGPGDGVVVTIIFIAVVACVAMFMLPDGPPTATAVDVESAVAEATKASSAAHADLLEELRSLHGSFAGTSSIANAELVDEVRALRAEVAELRRPWWKRVRRAR